MKNKLTSIFKDKKVVITGHTGFKGSWLTIWLDYLGAKVYGISNEIRTSPSMFEETKLSSNINDYQCDIRNRAKLSNIISEIKPDFLFHLAAQALVKESYLDPANTFETNLMGTVNVLDCIRKMDHNCTAVIITSDKCYDNFEWKWGYRENDKLGGPDPYSASKGAAEIAFQSYVRSYFSNMPNISIASARAGNVIGGGDWSKDRIIPDCIRSWSSGQTLQLRNPHSTRPWQHVLEPLGGYLLLARSLSINNTNSGQSYNFGPNSIENKSVLELVKEMSSYWEDVQFEDLSKLNSGPYESGLLKLNCDKALIDLNWTPTLNFNKTVALTSKWYLEFYKHHDILELTLDQIDYFMDQTNYFDK